DRLTLVRWIDLGCPIDLAYDAANPDARMAGSWMVDDSRPIVVLAYPRAGANDPLSRIVVGMYDYYTGLDMNSIQVVADFPVDGTAAGENLAAKFKSTGHGTWEWKLNSPLTSLPKGKLSVSVKDRQGNETRVVRTFSVVAAAQR